MQKASLERCGVQSDTAAILESEDTVLLCVRKQLPILESYLREHHGVSVRIETLAEFPTSQLLLRLHIDT